MKYFVKKMYVMIALLSAVSISYAYGDFDNMNSCEEAENCCPCEPSCSRGFVSADFIYWRAFEGGLDACIPTESLDIVTEDGRVLSLFRGKGRDPHFRWSPGFRLGAGYELPCGDWDIAAYWTHLQSRTHGSNRGNPHRWKIDFDVIDVVTGYNFDSCNCFTIRPFFGLRGARIDQKLRLEELSLSPIPSFIENRNKEKFVGIGPLIGIEADWNIGCGFRAFTSASVSWLYGNFRVRLNEIDATVDSLNLCRVSNRIDGIQAAADFALGIRWETCFCSNLVFLQLALEHHRYFDHNRFGNYGDLSFDGVTFSGGIEF